MHGQTLADELVAHTLVIVHAHKPPAPKEWTAHCAEIVQRRAAIHGVLVIAHGSGSNATQRHELREAWGPGTPPPVAVMTRSVVTRGILTALNWFMSNRLKPFSNDDFAGAFAYAQVPPAAQAEVL